MFLDQEEGTLAQAVVSAVRLHDGGGSKRRNGVRSMAVYKRERFDDIRIPDEYLMVESQYNKDYEVGREYNQDNPLPNWAASCQDDHQTWFFTIPMDQFIEVYLNII